MAFVQSANNPNNGSTVDVTLSSAPTQGNLLIAYLSQQSSNTWTAASGWTKLLVGSSSDEGGFFYKIAGASETAYQHVCDTSHSSRKWVVIIAEFSEVDSFKAQTADAANDATKSISMSLSTGERGIIFGGATTTSGDTTWSSHSVTGTSNAASVIASVGNGSGGNQTGGTVWWAEVDSFDASYTVSATASVAENGTINFAAFTLTSSAKNINVGQVTETDTAHRASRVSSRDVNLATDGPGTAQSITPTKRAWVEQAAEMDYLIEELGKESSKKIGLAW